ncbi:MAG: hypothetical protein HY565_05010 [Candidatus Kerfeldbacteria bacterium]|nr:hypothetical protein [Candidatus Kerfeldbacteria bacterium]
MNLKIWKQLNKSSWFMLTTITLVVVVWLVVILPAIDRLKRTVTSISAAQTSQSGSTQATANLITVLQRRSELEAATASLRQVFVNQANPVLFVSRLEELAAQHQVTMDLNVQEPDTSSSQVKIVPTQVEIQVLGQWADVLAFTQAIQTEPTALTIEQFTIQTPSSSPDVISLTIQTISYWRSL